MLIKNFKKGKTNNNCTLFKLIKMATKFFKNRSITSLQRLKLILTAISIFMISLALVIIVVSLINFSSQNSDWRQLIDAALIILGGLGSFYFAKQAKNEILTRRK